MSSELKAHEKLALTLKKKIHTGILETPAAEEELKLVEDLEKILIRYHLSPSIIPTKESSPKIVTNVDGKTVIHSKYDESINHVNSVLQSGGGKEEERFGEPRVKSLYQQAQEFSSQIFRDIDQSSEGKRRRKSFEEWYHNLENDLDVLESRLRKVRFLENELDRVKSKKYTVKEDDLQNHHDKFNDLHSDESPESMDNIKRRIKEMKYKVQKQEKELIDRIVERRQKEFPTSRSEGEL